jgi:hypothetical protein
VKRANAAADLAEILRHASPDTAALNADRVAWLGSGERIGSLPPDASSEHDEQCRLFAWASANEAVHPELSMLFAIPNGGARHPAVAAQLKAEGVKAGVPDCLLAVARGERNGKIYNGLFIEMKRKPNKPTQAQQEWIMRLRYYGYSAVVAYGCDEAISAIMAYLAQE